MYSYQHRYHAGNFADLHKHVVLLAVLEALRKKDTPFCVLDAFAGEGIYDLKSKESQKNKEYRQGFSRICRAINAPGLVQELLDIAKAQQVKEQTLIYPGSPALIRAKLRVQDQAIFIENHPGAYLQLKKHLGRNAQLHVHKRDAMEAINALVPFKEKRGLIFIDPSYEVKEEYQIIGEVVKRAYLKFPQGIYMVWYPLLREGRHNLLCAEFRREFSNVWQHEWVPLSHKMDGLSGSGIIIVNPPWGLSDAVQASLQFLQRS